MSVRQTAYNHVSLWQTVLTLTLSQLFQHTIWANCSSAHFDKLTWKLFLRPVCTHQSIVSQQSLISNCPCSHFAFILKVSQRSVHTQLTNCSCAHFATMGIAALTPTTPPANLIDLTGCTAIYTPGEGSPAFQSRDFRPMKTRYNFPIGPWHEGQFWSRWRIVQERLKLERNYQVFWPIGR